MQAVEEGSMPIKSISSRRDPRDGFTLHEVHVGQWLNSENIRRNALGEPLVKITDQLPLGFPDSITTTVMYE